MPFNLGDRSGKARHFGKADGAFSLDGIERSAGFSFYRGQLSHTAK